MSPDGKECNEWTEWVNEVSAGGRDKGPAFISLRSLLAGLVPCLSPRVSSLRSATRYARDRFAPVCDANGMSEERRERHDDSERPFSLTSLHYLLSLQSARRAWREPDSRPKAERKGTDTTEGRDE